MLTTLRLTQLRCHARLQLDPLESCNLLIGPNGAGKSTILEAIHLLARCRSFRTTQLRELAQRKTHGFRVAGEFTDEPFHKLIFKWESGQRTLTVDAMENVPVNEFWGRCAAVLIRNRDMALVQDRPILRRQWMDGIIGLLDGSYLILMQRFQQIIRQRNAILRHPRPQRSLWNALTQPYQILCEDITARREQFSTQISPIIANMLHSMTASNERFSIHYQSDFRRHQTLTMDQLWERETHAHATRCGPHLDDWDLRLNDHPLRTFGSEGQQRSVALALRLAEIEMITQHRKKPPIILIDDALRELDLERGERFWGLLPKEAQIFYASTQLTNSYIKGKRWNV